MSIRDVDMVDYAYLEDDSEMPVPVLVVSDPMIWNSADDEDHFELLRRKLNNQIAFVESGQIRSIYPPYEGGPVRVEVIARYNLSDEAEEFYGYAAEIMAEANMELEFRLCDA